MEEQFMISCVTVIAKSLKTQGIKYAFGIVGIPIIELASALQQEGIKYVGMRNEQAAAYAAQAIGFITKRPAVCLTVSGPGLLHVIAGMVNSNENTWPLIVISGASESYQDECGAFQEFRQIETSKIFSKFSARPTAIERIPKYVEKAIRFSISGRPGTVYLDFPGDMLKSTISSDHINYLDPIEDLSGPLCQSNDVKKVINLLKFSKRPLIIFGKGAAYCQAENEARELVNKLNIPFLATPMGKGLIPDDHPFSVNSARSRALQNADVILLLGARLNWILHFGLPPRFHKDVKIIQVDICAEELNNNVRAAVAVHADLKNFIKQMNDEISNDNRFKINLENSSWYSLLRDKCKENQIFTQKMISIEQVPMNYYTAFDQIKKVLPINSIIVSEGSNTMDIGRTMIENYLPRHRLDAGTFGTMGVGLGFAIACALWSLDNCPEKRIVCITGDSAFGFSGMELETICRYKLPITVIILNNNGISFGVDDLFYDSLSKKDLALNLPPLALKPNARYEKVMEAFGGHGYFITNAKEIQSVLKMCLFSEVPSLINIMIDPNSGKKSQEFEWLTTKDVNSKL